MIVLTDRFRVTLVQQGDHTKCNQDSRCHEDGYVCSKKPLVSERAIAAYRKAVEGTTIFKNAEDYALVITINNNLGILNSYKIINCPGSMSPGLFHLQYQVAFSI